MSDEKREFAGRLQELFEAALEYDGQQRSEFVARACGSDQPLREQLEALLAADGQTQQLLDSSPVAAEHLAEMLDEQPAAIPEQIGRFAVRRVIATGGMGTVYEAEQDHPRRTVALKVLRLSIASRSAQRRFQYESELLARLQHPGIAQVYEAGTHEDGGSAVPYFAMEYVPDAKSITQYADENDLKLAERLELFTEVCDAVHHGHEKGVIHRDLKPSNVLVDAAGRPRVIDFGIARSTDADIAVTTLQTETGQLLGTLQYMSPEQCEADPQKIDTRSDVYALGVLLYELLCGRPPYEVARLPVYEATRVVREQSPARLSTIDARLRGELETIVEKALAKDRDHRYRSAAELADDVRRYLAGEAITARPPSMVYQLRVFARRNKALVGGVVAVLLALTLGIIGTTLGLIQANRQRAQAEDARAEAVEVTTFLTDTLGAVNANRGRGPNVTLREVLEEAAQRIDGDEELADRPRVKATLHATIGKTYCSFGPYHSAAEKHLQTALKIRRRVFGREHPLVAEALHDLAIAVRWKGDDARVHRLVDDALAMRRKLLGEEHPDTLESVHYKAMLLCDEGKEEEKERAEALFRKVLRIRRKLLGRHPDVAQSLNALGHFLYAWERFDEAEPFLREALAMREELLGEEHPRVADTLRALGRMAWEKHDYVEAERLLRRALGIQEKTYSHERVETVHTIALLGRILWEKGESEEAEQLLRKAAERYPAVLSLGTANYNAADTRSYLGQCLAKVGHYDEAEEQLQQTEGILEALAAKKTPGISQKHIQSLTRKTIERRLALYEAWGKPEQAAQWRAKLSAPKSPPKPGRRTDRTQTP